MLEGFSSERCGKYLFGRIVVQVSHHNNLVLINACNGFSRIVDDLHMEESK